MHYFGFLKVARQPHLDLFQLMSSSSTSQDFLAQERDAKFKAWLQKKSVRDKAFEVAISLLHPLQSITLLLVDHSNKFAQSKILVSCEAELFQGYR